MVEVGVGCSVRRLASLRRVGGFRVIFCPEFRIPNILVR